MHGGGHRRAALLIGLLGSVAALGCDAVSGLSDYSVVDGAGGGGGDATGPGGGGSGGFLPELLSGESVLCRYFLETEPADVVHDASSHGIHLELLPDANMAWFAGPMGDGLEWQAVAQPGMAIATVTGTPLTQLGTSDELTIEVVGTQLASGPNGARIVHVGSTVAQEHGTLAFALLETGEIELRTNNAPVVKYANTDGDRAVYHLVLRFTLGVDAGGVRLFRNGKEHTAPVVLNAGAFSQPLLEDGAPFVLGNRVGGDRSPSGRVSYVAIYTQALTAKAIERHVTRLLADDDL